MGMPPTPPAPSCAPRGTEEEEVVQSRGPPTQKLRGRGGGVGNQSDRKGGVAKRGGSRGAGTKHVSNKYQHKPQA
eukprot:9486401-Pyramimonas_sp.AAC.1